MSIKDRPRGKKWGKTPEEAAENFRSHSSRVNRRSGTKSRNYRKKSR